MEVSVLLDALMLRPEGVEVFRLLFGTGLQEREGIEFEFEFLLLIMISIVSIRLFLSLCKLLIVCLCIIISSFRFSISASLSCELSKCFLMIEISLHISSSLWAIACLSAPEVS